MTVRLPVNWRLLGSEIRHNTTPVQTKLVIAIKTCFLSESERKTKYFYGRSPQQCIQTIWIYFQDLEAKYFQWF